jgi:cell division septal protein FtsQ
MRAAAKTTEIKSQLVRQRRSQTSQKTVRKAAATVRKPPRSFHQATVLSRDSSLGSTSLLKNSQSKSRRRLSVNMGNGAELILRNIPVIRPGWRLLSAFLVILISAVLYYTWYSPIFQVSTLIVKGNKRLPSADIQAVLGLSGKSIFTIDAQIATTKLVDNFPDITNVSVEVESPARVVIYLTERQPVMSWEYNSVQIWVDKDGLLFPARGKAKIPITIVSDEIPPTVGLAAPDQTETVGQAKNASQISEKLSSNPVNKSQINLNGQHIDPAVRLSAIQLGAKLPTGTVLVYSSKDGLGWTDKEGWNVYVGLDMNNMQTRLLIYNTIIKELTKGGIKPALVSVQNPNTPYYRLEK